MPNTEDSEGGGSGTTAAYETTCPPCVHDDLSSYIREEIGSYFKESYYTNNPLWPRQCVICARPFGGDDYKVGYSKPVWLCRNAMNKFHTCVEAKCDPCYKERMKELVASNNIIPARGLSKWSCTQNKRFIHSPDQHSNKQGQQGR